MSVITSILEASEAPNLRNSERDFSRAGPLSPALLVTLLLYMVTDANRRGYRHLLEAFWDEAKGHGISLPTDAPVAAESFCEARWKISERLLHEAIHQVALDFRENFPTALQDLVWVSRGASEARYGRNATRSGASGPGAPSLSSSVAPSALGEASLGPMMPAEGRRGRPGVLEPEAEGAGRALFTHTDS